MKKVRGNVGVNRVELSVMGDTDLRTEIAAKFVAALLSNSALSGCSVGKLVDDGINAADLLLNRLNSK